MPLTPDQLLGFYLFGPLLAVVAAMAIGFGAQPMRFVGRS